MANDYKYKNVTVSGLPGAGSTTLGRSLGEMTNWKYFSGGDFMREYAVKQGLFDEKNGLHHDATVYDDEFDRQVDFGMRKKVSGKAGNVLDSWLSGFMTQGVEGTLKVLVDCSRDDVRVDRVVNRDSVSIADAKKHIFEREEKNLKKWRRMYASEWKEWVVKAGTMPASNEIDFWDPRLYDLVIDTYSNSAKETLKLVLGVLEGKKSK